MKLMLGKNIEKAILCFLTFIFFNTNVNTVLAQLSISSGTGHISQNFNTLASSGTGNAQSGGIFSNGWSFVEGGTNANTTYDAGTGSSNTGNTYSFGSTSASDRAFGMLQSGSLTSILGFKFTNNTGATLTSITIGYTGEVWRLSSAADNLAFSYQQSDVALNASSGWTSVSSLSFTTPVTGTAAAVDGNASANRTVISPVTITGLSITNGSTFTMRWVDATGSSSAGMGIDDFFLTLEPTTQASAINFTSVSTSTMTVNWTNGNGGRRVAFMREASLGTITLPSDGTNYTASANWASKGTQLGTSGYYCIYNGTANNVALSNLAVSTNYHVYVFEYNSDGTPTASTINYYTATATNNPNNTTTLSAGGTPPTLSAAVGATVDAPFEVTFTDDATWRGAITGITINSTTLTTGWVISAGKITFTPSTSSPASLLQTSGIAKSIVVSASGYTTATVSQNINAGVPAKLTITQQPVGPTTNGAVLATQPIVQLQDQYNNTTNATTNATITAAAVQSTWNIGGTTGITITTGNNTATFTNITATNTSGSLISNATINFTSSPSLTAATSSTFTIPTVATEPADNPTTSAVINPTNPTIAIDVSWTTVTTESYIVLRRIAAQPDAPIDGTGYTINDIITNSIVVYIGNGNSFTDNGLTPGTEYRYRVYAFNGTGAAANYKTSPAPDTGAVYTLSAEPTNHANSFVATANSATNIALTFSAASTLPATGFLLLRKASAFIASDYPEDGVAYSVSAAVGNNGAVVNTIVSSDATTTASYTANADETWHFLLVPYNQAGAVTSTRNYRTQITIPTASATTASGLSDVVAIASSSPTTISSINNSNAPLTSTTGIQVWQISIRDGGNSLNDNDNLPTKVSSITFTAGTGNQVIWNTAIKTAALFDGNNFIASASSITATSIVFSGLNITVDDNTSKNIALRISLNETLGIGNDDGDDFVFQLSQANFITLSDGTSSSKTNFTAIQTANNIENIIAVVATKLLFVQQPTNVNTFTNINPAVTVRGVDINDNLDIDFTASTSIIANNSILSNSPVSVNAISGLATFGNLQMVTAGTGVTLTASSGTLTSATSNSFTVSLTPVTLAQWTFETSLPSTAGPHAAEVGTGNANSVHNSGSTTFSNPAGNGSNESFSADNWATGDYFQFQTSSAGYQNISISFDQTGSNTGPRDFKVQYSINGTSFTDLPSSTYSLTNDGWSNVSYNATSTRSFDLGSISSLNNKPNIYIRLTQINNTSINGSTVATGGTCRVDNFTINGTPVTFTWTGNGDGSLWNNPANWDCDCGNIPSISNPVVISNNANVLLNVNYTARSLTMQPTSTLRIAPTKILTVEGIADFNNQHIRVQSNATGTGSIGAITGIVNNATNVTVERYISALNNRRYRLLTPSINTTTSIRTNWQEGVNNNALNINVASPTSGYGTHITGAGGSANGFDVTQTNASSLFTYNQTSSPQAWVAVANTNTTTLEAKKGYLLFVRGNRDNINTINTATGSSNTILRARGVLLTGTQTFNNLESNGRFSLVTNPYPSSINWASIYSGSNTTNFENYITIWDPMIGFRGGYVTVTSDSVTSHLSSNLNIHLQSGQAYFVRTKALVNSPTLIIRETNKSSFNNLNVFRNNNTTAQLLRIELRYTENSAIERIADAVLARYNSNYSNEVDGNDAIQIANWDEDISLMRNNRNLSIESRNTINTFNDTLFIRMARLNTTQANYKWQINPTQFNNYNGLQAFLVDNFLGTTTAVSLDTITTIQFTITANTASQATDRFMLVLKPSIALPALVTSFTAEKKDQQINLKWQVVNEQNVKQYIVERGKDGTNFYSLKTIVAANKLNYAFTDINPLEKNYYRIRITDISGTNQYTNTVVVGMQNNDQSIAIRADRQGRKIQYSFNNVQTGSYQVQIINASGQVIQTQSILHLNDSASYTTNINNNTASGIYQVLIIGYGFKNVYTIYL